MKNEEQAPVEETPVKPAPATLAADDSDVENALDFLKENGVAIVVGAAMVVAAFVGYSAWQSSKETREQTASSMLANAQSAPQLQEIVANYGDTKAGPMAKLSLAAAYFDQGQYDLARQTFQQFETDHANHPMVAIAVLGNAQVLEAVGNTPEALAAYDQFIGRFPTHFQLPSATFGKARVLESMGRFDDARAVYEDFIAANPESRWISRAETGLEFVGKQQRAQGSTPAPATTTLAPIAPASETP